MGTQGQQISSLGMGPLEPEQAPAKKGSVKSISAELAKELRELDPETRGDLRYLISIARIHGPSSPEVLRETGRLEKARRWSEIEICCIGFIVTHYANLFRKAEGRP